MKENFPIAVSSLQISFLSRKRSVLVRMCSAPALLELCGQNKKEGSYANPVEYGVPELGKKKPKKKQGNLEEKRVACIHNYIEAEVNVEVNNNEYAIHLKPGELKDRATTRRAVLTVSRRT